MQSTLADGRAVDELAVITDRKRILMGEAAVFLTSFSRAGSLNSDSDNARLTTTFSDSVNAHLAQCYVQLAGNKLSPLEIRLWMPFVEQLRNDVRRIASFRSGGKSAQLDVALAKLRGTLNRSNVMI
jgi:hypothetical protein